MRTPEFIHPANERAVLPLLTPSEVKGYGKLRYAAEQLVQKNPANIALYNDFLGVQLDFARDNSQLIRQGFPHDIALKQHNDLLAQFNGRVDQIRGKYPNGAAALDELNVEAQSVGGGPVASALGLFSKGGTLRLGGIIGGALGLVSAFVTTHGGGYGGLGLLLFPLQLAAGAWAGNKVSEWLENKLNEPAVSPATAMVMRTQGQGMQPEMGAPQPENSISYSNIGTLPAQAFPNAAGAAARPGVAGNPPRSVR